MKPTLIPTLALAGSMTTRVSILQGSQLPTLVPKVPTVNGTALPTLIPAVSTIELPASMKHFNSTNGLQELSSLYPGIDWSSLPTYSILSDPLSLTGAAQDLPTGPNSVHSIESTRVLNALPSAFVTEIPGFTFSGPDGVVFHPPVINYDPEKPLDEIIVNIRGHLNCTQKCTSTPGPTQNTTTTGEGPKSSAPPPKPTTPCPAQVPQPTKFCHPEHCHNGHCHEKHCHKQSEVDELRKADPDWIWSPTSADDDERQRLADSVDAFSPLTMITLPRPSATPLKALQNTSTVSAAAQVVGALEPERTVETLQRKSRGHHRHHHHSRGGHSHHHHHNSRTRTSRPVALRSVVPPRSPPVPLNTNNSATAAAPSLPSSAPLTTTTTTFSPPLSLARRQLAAAAPSDDDDSSGGIENIVQSLMSTSTLSFLTPSRASSTTIPTPTPKAPSSAPASTSSASPTAQVYFTTIVSSYTSNPAHSPPTILITLARRSATPATPATATPTPRQPRAQRLKHQLNDESGPKQEQAQIELEQAHQGKGPKHCHGLLCPATLTAEAKATAPAKHASRSRSTSSAAASFTTPCQLIGGHRMGRRS